MTIVRASGNEADYVKRQRAMAAKLGAPGRGRRESATVQAYISDGRWVADCVCNAASLVDPSYTEAHCAECGRMAPLVFPEEWPQIEAILLTRPRTGDRNWHGESLDDLQKGAQ